MEIDEKLIDSLINFAKSVLVGDNPPHISESDYEIEEPKLADLIRIFNKLGVEYKGFSDAMFAISEGNLDYDIPNKNNSLAIQSIKQLQSNLRHLTWKTQRIASGDFDQKVNFMGDFSRAFNSMTDQLKDAFEKIEEQNNDLKRLIRKLEYSNEELESFAFVISHDLKNPLVSIISYFNLIRSKYADALGKDGMELTSQVRARARRMSDMIDDLLTYSRLTNNGKNFSFHKADAMLEYAVDNLKNLIEETSATITHDPLPDRVFCDNVQVTSLFQNLIGNSIKYIKEGMKPCIHVSCQVIDDPEHSKMEYCFSIKDNGIGIDRKHIEKIFIIFKRLHSNEEKYSGTGIGLAFCKKIVERHGGRIWVESAPGKGSTFYFTIPFKK